MQQLGLSFTLISCSFERRHSLLLRRRRVDLILCPTTNWIMSRRVIDTVINSMIQRVIDTLLFQESSLYDVVETKRHVEHEIDKTDWLDTTCSLQEHSCCTDCGTFCGEWGPNIRVYRSPKGIAHKLPLILSFDRIGLNDYYTCCAVVACNVTYWTGVDVE